MNPRPSQLLKALLVAAFFARSLTAAEKDSAPPAADEDRAAARRTLELIDCIVANHIDPPARQQLVLQAARVLELEAGEPLQVGLGRRVSGLSSKDATCDFLAEVWSRARKRSKLPDTLEIGVRNGILAGLRGSNYLIPAKEHAVQRQLAANRYVGTGIVLGSKDHRPEMTRVFEGGPAEVAGARDGDLIIEIEGADTNEMGLQKVVELLRGPAGSKVKLTLRRPRDQKQLAVEITRGEVPMKTLSFKRFETQGKKSIGYVRIDRITASTPHEFNVLESSLQNIETLAIDLRDVHEADLRATILLGDALLDGGYFGQIRYAEKAKRIEVDRDCLFRNRSLIVFVNGGTVGASEWLAIALHDGRNALLGGEPLPRRAFVSSPVPLPGRDDVLILATAFLERRDGRSLARLDASSTDLSSSTARLRPDGRQSDAERASEVFPLQKIDLESIPRAVGLVQSNT